MDRCNKQIAVTVNTKKHLFFSYLQLKIDTSSSNNEK